MEPVTHRCSDAPLIAEPRLGLAQLTRLAFEGHDLQLVRSQLLIECMQGLGPAGALMDLAVIDQIYGNRAAGLEAQQEALKLSRLYETRASFPGCKTLLVIAAPIHMGGNTPVEFLVRHSDYRILTYYPDFDGTEDVTLPAFDAAFCAAPADPKDAELFFAKARTLLEPYGTPLINAPRRFLNLDRDTVQRPFENSAGLRFPKTVRMRWAQLMSYAHNDSVNHGAQTYPMVIRPVGSHAGYGLERITSRASLIDYLTRSNDEAFHLSEFIDYASVTDSLYRKYRIVFIGGQAYPCHMAIADQWDVWYMNAGMQESSAKRAEEAAFFEQFQDFVARHRDALEALSAGIEFDYFGIDCAEDPDGNLVVFEADNALLVHDMDRVDVFAYKKRHMARIFEAFVALLDEGGTLGRHVGARAAKNWSVDGAALYSAFSSLDLGNANKVGRAK